MPTSPRIDAFAGRTLATMIAPAPAKMSVKAPMNSATQRRSASSTCRRLESAPDDAFQKRDDGLDERVLAGHVEQRIDVAHVLVLGERVLRDLRCLQQAVGAGEHSPLRETRFEDVERCRDLADVLH